MGEEIKIFVLKNERLSMYAVFRIKNHSFYQNLYIFLKFMLDDVVIHASELIFTVKQCNISLNSNFRILFYYLY